MMAALNFFMALLNKQYIVDRSVAVPDHVHGSLVRGLVYKENPPDVDPGK